MEGFLLGVAVEATDVEGVEKKSRSASRSEVFDG
jgi:hypothetical protein